MKNRSKRWLALGLSAGMILSLYGCGGSSSGNDAASDAPASQAEQTQADTKADSAAGTEAEQAEKEEPSIAGTNIEMTTRMAADTGIDVLKELIAEFEAETGATITLTEYPINDYNSMMKTRIAANDFPDVWETHGESKVTYGEYLMPVNNEEWYDKETDLAKGILTGGGDEAYALMINSAVAATICNKTAADAAGVDVYAIRTVDDFKEACQTIIDAGLVPMADDAAADLFGQFAGIYTCYPDAPAQDGESILNGTWDWESFVPLLQFYADLLDMGAFWEDASTITIADSLERVASGKSVFLFARTTPRFMSLVELNPDNEYVMIPCPAVSEDAKQYCVGGEDYAVGIWKDTEQPETCRAWLEFLARPENSGRIVSVKGGIPTLTDCAFEKTMPVQAVEDMMERYPDLVYNNMWSREYLGALGMWGTFGEAAGKLFTDHSPENITAIKDFLKEAYDERYEAAYGE